MPLPPLVSPTQELSTKLISRYSRHIVIPEVGMAGQRRLASARVLVVGAGGLGSPTLLYLAAAGVGTIGIVEFDLVDESNLQRQIIHGQADVDEPKAHSAAASIRALNPHVTVEIHDLMLDSENVMDVFVDYDLIIDGTDNFATRYLINDACVLLGKPYVWGSIYRFEGQASVFWAEHGPCYRCLYPEPPPPGMAPSCAEGGVLGVLCASIGSIQTTEAVKLLLGIGEPLVGQLMVYDGLEMSYRKVAIRKDPDCAICGERPSLTGLIDYDAFCGVVSAEAALAAKDATISARQLAQMLAERERGERVFELIDVREHGEWEIVAIPGARRIGKWDFLIGDAMAQLPRDVPVVFYCKVGERSAEILALAHAAGLADAKHVGGGVLAWVDQIAPELPSY